jgi:phosphoribosylglycinamide formyltransferase 1
MLRAVQKKSIIIFASGNGSNAEAIIQHFKNTEIAHVALIVCNNMTAGVLEIAQNHNIPFLIINKKTIEEPLIITQLNDYKPDLLVLAGFLWKIPDQLMAEFPNKIINIHPALLPKFGGKGMYGLHVHAAVLAAKETETGITIHYVNEQYDEGALILQAHCPLSNSESVTSISKKVNRLEHTYYPITIELLLKMQ